MQEKSELRIMIRSQGTLFFHLECIDNPNLLETVIPSALCFLCEMFNYCTFMKFPRFFISFAVVHLLSWVWLLATPWTVAHQAPLSMGISRQEYWSGLPFPSPGEYSGSGSEPVSPALADGFFTTEPAGKPLSPLYCCLCSALYNTGQACVCFELLINAQAPWGAI